METKVEKQRFPFIVARNPESHKGDYGHALLIAGSYGKMGAAVLAARACLRAGVGLLTVHVPRCGVDVMQTAVPEAMLSIDNDEHRISSMPADIARYTAIGIGPGLGTDEVTAGALIHFLEKKKMQQTTFDIPLVLDADALNIIAQHPESLHLVSDAVVTPHAREYERLFGDSDPQQMADMHDLVIVKKAHRTIVYAPGCEAVVNNTGNAGMATAGSGDVLTGLTLGLQTQASAYAQRHYEDSYNMQDVVALAVYLHGRAGDIAAERFSQPSLISSDIISCIPEAVKELIV